MFNRKKKQIIKFKELLIDSNKTIEVLTKEKINIAFENLDLLDKNFKLKDKLKVYTKESNKTFKEQKQNIETLIADNELLTKNNEELALDLEKARKMIVDLNKQLNADKKVKIEKMHKRLVNPSLNAKKS